MTKIKKNKFDFTWNVWLWNFNHDELETYDVVPIFMRELERLKKKDLPKTKKEFSEFLNGEAQYHFWSKCEYEMIIHGWPVGKKDVKVDVYDQLILNWDKFVDAFWNNLPKKFKSNSK